MNPPRAHDLMIVFDAETGGTAGVTELKQAITDIINFMSVSDCFRRIGVLAYRNSATDKVIEWSRWCRPSSCEPIFPSTEQVLKFVQDLKMPFAGPGPGSNSNCAIKTALAKAYLEMSRHGTIILLYAHAPPALEDISDDSYNKEQTSLASEYGEEGLYFQNWINGANTLAGFGLASSDDNKKAVVLSFTFGDDITHWSPYLYLSQTTGGDLYRTIYSGRVISQLAIGLLLIWMRVDGNIDIPESTRLTYINDPTQFCMVSEASLQTCCGLNFINLDIFNTLDQPRDCFRLPYGGVSTNNQQVSKYTSRNLARNYHSRSEPYKKVIVKHLDRMIRTNVWVIAIHPLYGQLFRTVCEDQTSSRSKRAPLRSFRKQINQILDITDMRQIRNWFKESYTLYHEINEEISALPAQLRFPLVYIPPERIHSGLTRTQLLSMWESCDMDDLKPLGDILNYVHRVKKEEDMPDTMSQWSPCLAPRIPLALISNRYRHKF